MKTKDLKFIKKVYDDLFNGIEVLKDVNDAYFMITQECLPENQRVIKIINWVENEYDEELRLSQKFDTDLERISKQKGRK